MLFIYKPSEITFELIVRVRTGKMKVLSQEKNQLTHFMKDTLLDIYLKLINAYI